MNFTEFLTISAAIVPDRPATIFEGRRQTYAELQSNVNRLANALSDLGVAAGDRIAMLQVNCPEHIEAGFASAKLDAVFVPLNFRTRPEELRYMVNDCAPKVLFVGGRYTELVASVGGGIPSVDHCVSLEGRVEGWLDYGELLDAAPDDERYPEADADHLCVIMYTAGTTGFPKGVMLTHDSFSSYILSAVTPADPDIEERNILTVPLYHIAGVQALMSAVYGGRTLIVQRQFEPAEWMALVERERADRAMMVPTMLKMLMDHEEFGQRDLSSLRVITYGAAPMPLDTIRRALDAFPGAQFINAFGQTETAATITMLPPDDHVLSGSEDEIARKLKRLTSIGKPLDDVEVRIVDEHGRTAPVGEVGEIAARGERLMKGYWGQEDATRETIRDGWLYTGDLGYVDEDGYVFLAGRAKDFIKRGGEMISPEEVEQTLGRHPGVDEAAIISVPDPVWGERVRAVVVPRQDGAVDESELIEFCRQRLASFKKPESVVFIDELPRNALGKVLKRVLQERYAAPIEE